MTEFIEKSWKEITSRNPITDDQFATGLKDFKFSVGQGYGFIPNLSYFRVELELTVAGVAPIISDDVVFADGPIGNMFNNIYFNMGGQTVSSLTTGLGQCEVLKNRLTKSKAYNDTIGKATGFVPHYQDRITYAYDSGGGDEIEDVNSLATQNRNHRMFIWKPSLGIFDVATPLGCGEYDIQLNPSQDYVLSAIQTRNGSTMVVGTGANQVMVKVKNFRCYACMVRVNLPASGVETLHLMEMSVHTVNAKSEGVSVVEINEEVSVPSSTRAISVFLQDARAGKTSQIPPSKFGISGDPSSALTLRDYQIQYANMTKPTVRYNSQYSDTVDTLQQRYINCALESGQFFNPSGFESYEQYLERGLFLHESFVKSADNLATRVQIVASYGNISQDCRLYIIAHHSATIQVTRQNGLVVDIRSLNV